MNADFWDKIAIYLIHIVIFMCVPINANHILETKCPSNFSYTFEGKCYSLHTDAQFNYVDAVKECKEKGGVLWAKNNENEVNHLRRIRAKLTSDIWIGARDVGGVWKYLSDNITIPKELEIDKSHRSNECLAMQEYEDKLRPLSCKYKINSICTFSGDKCDNGNKECHQFIHTEQNFDSAAEKCKLLEGKLAEIRSRTELEDFKEMIRKDNELESIPRETLNKLSGSKIPTIWMLTSPPITNNTCNIFKDFKIQSCSCNAPHGYICMCSAVHHIEEDQITIGNSETEQSTVNSMTLEQYSSNPPVHITSSEKEYRPSTVASTTPEETPSIQENNVSELTTNDMPSTIESIQQMSNNKPTKQSTISDPISTTSFREMTHENEVDKIITTEQSARIQQTVYVTSSAEGENVSTNSTTSSAEGENVSTNSTTISSSNPTPRINENTESSIKSSTTTEFSQRTKNNESIEKSVTTGMLINSSTKDVTNVKEKTAGTEQLYHNKVLITAVIVMGISVIAGIIIIIIILINIMKKTNNGNNLRRNSRQLNDTFQRTEFERDLPRTPSDITVENSLYAEVDIDETQPLHSTEDNVQHQYTYILQ